MNPINSNTPYVSRPSSPHPTLQVTLPESTASLEIISNDSQSLEPASLASGNESSVHQSSSITQPEHHFIFSTFDENSPDIKESAATLVIPLPTIEQTETETEDPPQHSTGADYLLRHDGATTTSNGLPILELEMQAHYAAMKAHATRLVKSQSDNSLNRPSIR